MPDSHKVYYGKFIWTQWRKGRALEFTVPHTGRSPARKHSMPLVMIGDQPIEKPHTEPRAPAAIDLAVD